MMRRKTVNYVVLPVFLSMCALVSALPGCGRGDQMGSNKDEPQVMEKVSDATWRKLSSKRIYFGHQSVGSNIIDGIRDILKEHAGLSLDILESTNPDDMKGPALIHSKLGTNFDPHSKISSFGTLMREGFGSKVDIAFFKFCYIDIFKDTDVTDIFNHYTQTMRDLKKKYGSSG